MSARSESAAMQPEELLSHDRWLRILVSRLVHPDIVEDIVQDTFAQALASPPEKHRAIRAWLARVAANFARKKHRSDARRQRRERMQGMDPELMPDTADLVARVDAQRHVAKLVLGLDEPYRTTVLLRFFEDLSCRQIATRMNVPHATVRTRLQRALARLRKQLDDGEGPQWRAIYTGLFAIPDLGASVSATIPASAAAAKVQILNGALWMTTKSNLLAAACVLLAAAGLTVTASSLFDGSRATDIISDGRPGDGSAAAANTVPRQENRDGTIRAQLAPPRRHAQVGDQQGLRRRLVGQVFDRSGTPVARAPIVFESDRLPAAPTPHQSELEPEPEPNPVAGPTSVESRAAPARGPTLLLGYSHGDGSFDVQAPRVSGTLRTGAGFVTLRAWQLEPDQQDPADHAPVADCLLVVAPAVRVSGFARNPEGKRLAGVRCFADVGALAAYPGILDRTLEYEGPARQTDARGQFTLDRVPAIPEARLIFWASGYKRTGFVVPTQDTTDLEIVMEPDASAKARLTGRVQDSAGRPVADAHVTFGVTARTRTGTDGCFLLETDDLWSEHPLVAVKQGYQAAVADGLSRRLADKGEVKNVVLELEGPALHISGRVVDHRGRPVPGLRIYIWNPTFLGGDLDTAEAWAGGLHNAEYGVLAVTGEGGEFDLGGLRNRDYVLRVFDEQTKMAWSTKPLPAGSKGHEVTLPEDVMRQRVTGRIVDRNGAGMAGVALFPKLIVRLARNRTRNIAGKHVKTDQNGYFTLANMSRYEAQLAIEADQIVPVEYAIPPEHSGLDLCITVQRRCHFKLEPGRFAERKRVWVQFLDDGGRQLTIHKFSAHGWSLFMRWYFHADR